MNRPSFILTSKIIFSVLLMVANCSAAGPAGNASAKTRREVTETLNRLGSLTSKKDPTLLSEFSSTDSILIGSDPGEVADGRAQLELLINKFFAQPFNAHWEWQNIRVSASHSIAWVYAEGKLVIHTKDGDKDSPYRLTGVLEHKGKKWLWRQFNGSEPPTIK